MLFTRGLCTQLYLTFINMDFLAQVLGEIAGSLKAILSTRVWLFLDLDLKSLFIKGAEAVMYLQTTYLPSLQMSPPLIEVVFSVLCSHVCVFVPNITLCRQKLHCMIIWLSVGGQYVNNSYLIYRHAGMTEATDIHRNRYASSQAIIFHASHL